MWEELLDMYQRMEKIRMNVYGGSVPEAVEKEEGDLLFQLIGELGNRGELAGYRSCLARYEEICGKYNDSPEPLLKVRLAKNLWGWYYIQKGDYQAAERAALEALKEKLPEGVPEILPEAIIRVNLMSIYFMQNDLLRAASLAVELLDALEQEEDVSGLKEDDRYRIFANVQSILNMDPDALDRDTVKKLDMFSTRCCERVLRPGGVSAKYGREIAGFICNAAVAPLTSENCGRKKRELYYAAVCQIGREPERYPLTGPLEVLRNYMEGVLAWVLEKPGARPAFQRVIDMADKTGVRGVGPATMLLEAACYFSENGEKAAALGCLEKAFHSLSEGWQSCVKYLNDDRLIQALSIAGNSFILNYAILRELTGTDRACESVLRFKATASLAIRERNRILHQSCPDQALLERIRELQDRLASSETIRLYGNLSEQGVREEEEELRRLELEFAARFPENSRFTEITLERVKEAIPDQSVVLEYVFCLRECERSPDQLPFVEGKAEIGFDVYIFRKKDRACTLDRVQIPMAEQILRDAVDFVDILQAGAQGQADPEGLNQAEELRFRLYKRLIRPVLPWLEGFADVYIAPDAELVNLPFEILYDEEQECLEDHFSVVRIECARDFLFRAGAPAPSGEDLVIGDPRYSVLEQDMGELKREDMDQTRFNGLDPSEIKPLPFSGLEARLVAGYCGCVSHTGKQASKELLLSARGCRSIHIATHGYFDLSGEDGAAMFSSCLLFAGVCNWRRSGRESSVYGNGIVTADEISRLDLHSTELVVLSSCLSGMNDVSLNRGFCGMVGALAAAGAEYVISHLWAADDFGTAILMEAFYYEYRVKKHSPPEALHLAKAYLKRVTVGELKRRNWFAAARAAGPGPEAEKTIHFYERMSDRVRPFKNEAYWGGFTCTRCGGKREEQGG